MKTFQKIKSLDNQERFNQQLADKGVDVITYEKDDNLTITEKIDGSNAQVMNDNGKLRCFSHHKELSPDNTLNGFYGFVQEHENLLLGTIHDQHSLFGEWLVPHKVKYPDNTYHKWYLFDECDMSHHNTNYDVYLGFNWVKFNYNKFIKSDDIKLVPEYDSSKFNPDDLEGFDKVRESLSHYSLLGADEGKAEGIVITDNDRDVSIDENTIGLLRFKCVNEAFKEVRRAKKPIGEGQKASISWANKYITEPRVNKKIFGLQEDGIIKDELSFDWMKNGNAKMIAQEVVKDALEESEETPVALSASNSSYDKNMKAVQKFTNKLTNKVIALKVKGLA